MISQGPFCPAAAIVGLATQALDADVRFVGAGSMGRRNTLIFKQRWSVSLSNVSAYLAQNFQAGKTGALRLGLNHGLYCLGCCWALMGILFVAGVMNLA